MQNTKNISVTIPIHIWEKFIKYRKIVNVSGICARAIEKAIIAIEKSDLEF
mgnify:FL=1